MSKNAPDRYFEDFYFGQTLRHATPRTLTEGEVALYGALYGGRFAIQSGRGFARAMGYPAAPVDDLLVFHTIFGKSVPDVSRNAVANLGYAEGRFLKPVYPGDTLSAVSEVIGCKENSSGQTGTVYVRTTGFNQRGELVLSYVRWVMVNKREPGAPATGMHEASYAAQINPQTLGRACPPIDRHRWDNDLSGSPSHFADYAVGEKIDHVDGMTVEEADHMLATRLYQNTAKVHFNQFEQAKGRFGRRLIYGGHVISLARALSFNGLANAFHISAINAGRHVAPLFSGGTVYAWSQVTDKAEIAGRADVGALRILTRATKDHPCTDFPTVEATADTPGVILAFDYWVLIPK